MSRHPSRRFRLPMRRTRCNVASLIALGLLSMAGTPAGAAVAPGTIPVLRGLVSDYSKIATFSTTPSATAGGQTLTINQLLPQLVLDWQSFNVANGSVVQFIQPSSSAAVLNRIYDKNPSVIEGQIKANGQVYLVNQNGILFNRGSQVNVATLVASTLNITDANFKAGIASGGLFTPALTGGYATDGSTVVGAKSGSIVIGGDTSTAAAPQIGAASGGAIVIVAPIVDNHSGVLTSPDGQVILAAGTSAYLGFTPTAQAGFRGMQVEVTAGSTPLNLSQMIASSTVTNGGTISADRGNVTLAGLAINQAGRISATSAMQTNGSIYLQARTLGDAQGGEVTLAAGSVTETPLDTTDKSTLSQSTSWTPYRPVVNISGAQIDVEGTLTSPSGAVALTAADPSGVTAPRVFLGAGSVVDASGAWSTASDASNLLTFKVTSTELKDAPDQQSGILLGSTVTVDLRNPSNLLDLTAYQQEQARTLAEKASAGGVVTLTSAGDVVQQAGSTIDVSGGGVHYAGVTESTTQLLGSDGKLYDIGTAPEGLKYTQIANSFTVDQARWGYSQTYGNLLAGASLKRPDFVEGAAGGALQVTMTAGTKGVVLDGTLLGGTTTGSQQTAAAPLGATLTIGSYDSSKTNQDLGIGDVTFLADPAAALPSGFTLASTLGDTQKSQLVLSTDVFSAGAVDASGNYVTTGFGTVDVNANGRVTVPENVTLAGPIGGTLALQGNQVEIDGHVTVPSGTVVARTIGTTGTAASPVASSSVVVAQTGAIDTRGTWVNNDLTGVPTTQPTATVNAGGATVAAANGGSITIDGPIVTLAAGSVLDVSAGGRESPQAVFSGGSAGAISIAADATQGAQATQASLTLAGTLSGYDFGGGGALTVKTGSAVQIASTAVAVSATATLDLGPAFFQQGGFGSFTVGATGDLAVTSGTILLPSQTNLLIDPVLAQALASGANLETATRFVTLPDNTRKPTGIALSSAGNFSMAAGSAIGTDPGASVSLAGGTGVDMNGVVLAKGGSIAVSLVNKGVSLGSTTPTLELGADAVLDAYGTFVATPNDKGLAQGTLLAGGSVTLTTQAATLDAVAGSVIDVSGASHVVDLPSAAGATTPYEAVQQNSNAGTVGIVANDSVTLGGAIRGTASGSAAGGSFALTLSDRGDIADQTQRRIVVTGAGATQATVDGFHDADISVAKLTGAGFDKLRLSSEDQIVFADAATLDFQRGVTLDTKLLSVAGGASVAVSGVEVELANSWGERTANTNGNPQDLSTIYNATAASIAQPTAAGTGVFKVVAGTLDVFGSVTLGGTQSETLTATNDLRLSGRTIGTASSTQGATLSGALTTAGDLAITAAQVYPTTGSSFTIGVADGLTGTNTPDGQLTITRSGGVAGDVFSAGGSLTLKADAITQDGSVLTPLGTLNLQAGKTLTLGSGSLTSVSANGLTIPYGETQDGVTWTYAPTGSNPQTASLAAPPAKHISLSAPAVDVLGGATVDVSGGGDVQATEYVPSSTTSKDALLQPGTYAIIPAANLAAAPVDPDIAARENLGFGKDSAVYDSIHIGPGGPVPAGDYVLLPGYYALLKGGYVVQLLTGSAYGNLQSGQTATLQNGLTVVPGQMVAAGTVFASNTTLGVVIRPNTDIPKLSDYTVTDSAFFAALAASDRTAVPLLPIDGGQLSIAATERLTLDGTLAASLPTDGSRSAEVDIAASRIALVDQVGRGDIDPTYLQIDSGDLSKLDASLLIGGVRSETSTGEVMTPTATDIVVANSDSQELKAPELVLAATDSITVKAGSRIDGTGGQATKGADFTVGGAGAASGAILRVSNSGLVAINRPATDSSQGTITVEAGATIAASGSVALDATGSTTSAGKLAVASGGALSLTSGTLSLGDTDGVAGLGGGVTGGLVLDNAQLAAFGSLGTLSLKGYDGIALYGNTQLGGSALGNLVLDTGTLTGVVGGDGAVASAQVAAADVTLRNSSATPVAPGVGNASAGALAISAGTLVVGVGTKSVSGFGTLQLRSTGEIVATGTGTLQTASTLELQSARIDSTSGANQAWSAQDGSGAGAVAHAVTLTTVATATPLADSTAIGSRLQVAGSNITDGGAIVMKGGSVALQSQGDLVLGAGSVIDAGGIAKNFQGVATTADAGQVSLASAQGAVRLLAGSTVNVAASDAGGDAGSLSVSGTAVQVDGTLLGGAKLGAQGSFTLDVSELPQFSALNATLNAAGFTAARDIRVRDGDLVVAAGDVVTAHQLTLESDTGTVTVAGRLDASAASGGGSVEIDGTNVTVTAGATIAASGTSTAVDMAATPTNAAVVAPYSNGGDVTLVAQGGTLAFAPAAVVDVRAGAKGAAGSVLLRAPRTADSVQAVLAGQVLSQRHAGDAAAAVIVEGNRVYGPAQTGDTVTQSMIAGYGADNVAWMAAVNANALAAGIRGDDGTPQSNVQVRPAVEVQAAGDLTIAANWNLAGAGWLVKPAGASVAAAGSLVVRAAGDLTLASVSVGNPDASLQAGATWNIGLVGGADLRAANAFRTQSTSQLAAQAAQGLAGAGDLVLDSADGEASVRTGTGDIHLAAGRDFVVKAGTDADGNPLSGVVFTSGVAAVIDANDTATSSRFTQGGGDVTITAGRDAIGAGDEWLTEWYRVLNDGDASGAGAYANGAWWAYLPNFHDGVATFGGGNLTILAGNDVRGLSAYSTTSALVPKGGSLATFGGGRLQVHAGNDILGGQYLLALGSGSIGAGGDVGQVGRESQVFIMGASGDAALAGASVAVKAGGGIALTTIDNPASLWSYAPTTVGIGPSFNGYNNAFPVLTYTADSAVSLTAASGDVRIGDRPADSLALDPNQQFLIDNGVTSAGSASLLPARVAFTAFSGNIVYTGQPDGMTTFPSADGRLQVMAGGSVQDLRIRVSDADTTPLAIQNLALSSQPQYSDLLATHSGSPNRLATNTSTDAFIDDVVALGGSIQGGSFTFPVRSRLWAAQDVVDPTLNLQNLAAGDLSEVIADQGSLFVNTSSAVNAVAPWSIAGPGTLLLQAGQDVDLGAGALLSVGNQFNASLRSTAGADIVVAAGTRGAVDPSRLDAAFGALVKAGTDAKPDAAAAATTTLFAGSTVGKGNIDSSTTSIQSDAGGTINLLAPGGNITVGLPTPNAAVLIGVVTNAGGAIRSYLSGDFDINQGKVLTAQGGDIVIYTALGSIDAGRGAHTSVTTPPPTRTPITDSDGNVTGYAYSIPAAVAGSGIQTATSPPNGPGSTAPPAGNIYLFAPAGTIDAGEAGINSGGAIVIAALTVLNADNISSVGTSVGVPQVAAGSLASTAAAAGATNAANAANNADTAAQAAAAAAAAGPGFKPAILTVEVMGFGDKNCKEQDKDCLSR